MRSCEKFCSRSESLLGMCWTYFAAARGKVNEDEAIACKRRRATPRSISRHATSLDARRL